MRTLAGLAIAMATAFPLGAVDGVLLISQSGALAGGVTPGDTPGFPVTISAAGSYKLSGNLTVPDANTTAIEITADDVRLDLNGFAIIGPTVCSQVFVAPNTLGIACSPTGSGRGVTNPQHNSGISVFNGTVRGLGGDGINLFLGSTYHIENVRALNNGGSGIFSLGQNFGDVVSCTASANGRTGIEVHGAAIGNFVEGNGSYGILSAGITMNNFVRGNVMAGIQTGSVVTQNFVAGNQGGGIVVDCPANVQANLADGNGDLTPGQQISFVNNGCVRVNNSPL